MMLEDVPLPTSFAAATDTSYTNPGSIFRSVNEVREEVMVSSNNLLFSPEWDSFQNWTMYLVMGVFPEKGADQETLSLLD